MLGFLKKLLGRGEGESLFCSAVVPAAGASSRMEGENKLFASLGGAPVLGRTMEALSQSELISEIVVAVQPDELLRVADICRTYVTGKPVKVVCGGESRLDSVMAALAECSENADLVAVHDGARPLVTAALIDETIRRAAETYAAAPAVPVSDTIKVASGGIVEQTPDRSTLYAVQTPQVFDRDLLQGALQAARDSGAPVTDDCSAVERLGKQVFLTEGSYENLKITTPIDLVLAEAIWENREAAR